MECGRCCGLMVRTDLTDSLAEEHEMFCWGWRCVLCGEIVDRQILRNRARQAMLVAVDSWPMTAWNDARDPAEMPAYQGDTPP